MVLFLCFFDGCGQAFPGSIPRFSRPVPLALIIHLFFRQNKGTPRRCGGFLQSCNTQPFCMGRTVDFSCRMLYDKNGFARTQSRIIESCPRMLCGGYRKGRKTARCQPERNGAKEPHANGTVGARMHRSGKAAGTKVRHWGQSPEKVGCKRGAIGSMARGRRIARRRAFSAAGVIFVGRRQEPCAAGVSLFQGMYRRFLQRACICFSSAADTLR